jgi:hypothetical protein
MKRHEQCRLRKFHPFFFLEKLAIFMGFFYGIRCKIVFVLL